MPRSPLAEQGGLVPAHEAGRAEWLRRASPDLTGLPPTLGELDAFLADPDPLAVCRRLAVHHS